MALLQNKTVLLYSVPAEVHRQISEVALSLGIDCKKIAKARFKQKLGCHVGVAGYISTAERYEGGELAEPMLVFSGIPDKLLDRFLAEYKKAGIPDISCKAIVTPYNIEWNTFELFDELIRERQNL